jgi:hypothetical protein
MSNKERTSREVVEKMYREYLEWQPVVKIAKKYGLSRYGVYFLFEREGFPRNRLSR